MELPKVLVKLLDSLLDTDPLHSWNIFNKSDGKTIVKLTFGSGHGKKEPPSQVRRDEARLVSFRQNQAMQQQNTTKCLPIQSHVEPDVNNLPPGEIISQTEQVHSTPVSRRVTRQMTNCSIEQPRSMDNLNGDVSQDFTLSPSDISGMQLDIPSVSKDVLSLPTDPNRSLAMDPDNTDAQDSSMRTAECTNTTSHCDQGVDVTHTSNTKPDKRPAWRHALTRGILEDMRTMMQKITLELKPSDTNC